MSRLTVAALAALLGGGPAAADSGTMPREGERAEQDLFCPQDTVVVDVTRSVQTAAARAELVPVVLRSSTGTADDVIDRLHADFAAAREAFLAAEAEAGSPAGSSAQIVRAVETFRLAHRELPISAALAQQWAHGDDGSAVLRRMTLALRRAMSGDLAGDLPKASTIFVVTIGVDEPVKSWGAIASIARIVEPRSIFTLEVAADRLRATLSDGERELAGYLTGLLRPTVEVDDYLTSLLFQERLGAAAETRAFAAGEPIVRAGEVLDRWGALALAHLRRSGLSPAVSPTAGATVGAAGEARPTDRGNDRRSWRFWLPVAGGVGVVAGVGVLLYFAWRRLQRRRADRRALLVLPEEDRKYSGIRRALLPHLAREMKDRLVHALFAQRMALLEQEADATRRVEELEARLAKLQPAFAARVRTYEERIRALERQLEEKDQETRDLIRAKLVLARQELASEIARNRIDWN